MDLPSVIIIIILIIGFSINTWVKYNVVTYMRKKMDDKLKPIQKELNNIKNTLENMNKKEKE